MNIYIILLFIIGIIIYFFINNKNKFTLLRKIIKNKKISNFYFPNNNIKKLLNLNNIIIYKLPKAYLFNNKNTLWKILNKYYYNNNDLVPETHIITNDNNNNINFLNKYKNKFFLLKKNIENGNGIFISNNKDEIINKINYDKGYKVMQIYINNPLLINKRAFKIRYFILHLYKNNIISNYIYKNGLVYYTKDIYDKNNLNENNIIANAYWYKKTSNEYVKNFINNNPLTTLDLHKFLNYNIIENRIHDLVKKVLIPVNKQLYKKTNTNNTLVLISGIDIIIDNNMKPWFIEANTKPGMGSHNNSTIKNIKTNMYSDMLDIVYDKNNNNNKFIKLI